MLAPLPNRRTLLWWLGSVLLLLVAVAAGGRVTAAPQKGGSIDRQEADTAIRVLNEGRQTYRFDTFGDEDFWGGRLKLHQAIQGTRFGGIGNGISPRAALALGLKVDSEAIPRGVASQIKSGKLNLDDPAVTLDLLKLNAVVGVAGIFDASRSRLQSVGITCALCHSTVDDSFAPGIGRRLDGWPARDLNVGAIIAAAPDLSPVAALLGVDEATVKKVVLAWGPGRYDAELNLDGKAFRPDGKTAATLLPAAFGLSGVNSHTWTGSWGTVTYWNAYVANLQMMGKGVFFDPRLDNAQKYPIAARARLGHKRDSVDLITSKLPALQVYQLSLVPPKPPAGSFDPKAAERGVALFNGKAQCATCHVPPIYTEPGWNLHTPEEIGIDAFQANRAPDNRYRTSPLRGLFTRQKGGFYHDGRFADLGAVVDHYNQVLRLSLTGSEKGDLVQYLKSL